MGDEVLKLLLGNGLEHAGAKGEIGYPKLLSQDGFGEILVCDSRGILADSDKLPPYKRELAKLNKRGEAGSLADALKGADALVGVSAPNIVGGKEVAGMASSPIIFALSNPVPEIAPAEAKKAGCAVFGTARADLPNQVNNVLGFPGIFRGALMVRASGIIEGMKLAAAHALAGAVPESALSAQCVVPNAFDRRVVPLVATAVAEAAMKEGVARLRMGRKEISEELGKLGLLG